MRIHLDGVGGSTPAPGDEIHPCGRSHVMRVVVQRLGRALKLPLATRSQLVATSCIELIRVVRAFQRFG